MLVGNFYRGLANEARERAARASNLSIKDKFEEVAKEWSALAVRAELNPRTRLPPPSPRELANRGLRARGKGLPAIGYVRQPQQISLAPEAFSLSRGLYATDMLPIDWLTNPRAIGYRRLARLFSDPPQRFQYSCPAWAQSPLTS